MINKKALNLEMLKIAGFTCAGGIWTYPDGVDVDNGVPFFPGSLDECITWIFPKLDELGEYYITLQKKWNDSSVKDVAISYVSWTQDEYNGEASNYATAFCLAVQELKERTNG